MRQAVERPGKVLCAGAALRPWDRSAGLGVYAEPSTEQGVRLTGAGVFPVFPKAQEGPLTLLWRFS